MRDKKDLLPIGIAIVVAFAVTGVVRLMFPYASDEDVKKNSKKILSIPEIPVVAKSGHKTDEVLVLVVARPIKKDQAITLASLEWKRWPMSALQPNFIAKDNEGRVLNNAGDHTAYNGSTWAKSDIQVGLPFLVSMTTPEDPVKKAEEAKRAAEEKRRKALEKEKSESFIKKGMRAVTFPLDQRLASSSNMFSPGELVDVLIINNGEKSKTYKYKAVKILAIDGITKFEGSKNASGVRQSSGFLGTIQSSVVGGLMTPKTVTLEIKEELVDTMLKQSGDRGVVLSLRNQKEAIDGEDSICEYVGDEDGGPFDSLSRNRILKSIMEISKTSAAAILQNQKAKKIAEENNIANIISNMNALASNARSLRKELDVSKKSVALKGNTSGRYEIVSGKVTDKHVEMDGEGEKGNKKPKKMVTIYKKLSPNAIQFNENGEAEQNNNGMSSEPMGMHNSKY